MCGRVIVKTTIAGLVQAFAGVAPPAPEEGLAAKPPSWNGAPRQTYPLILWQRDSRGPAFVAGNWGFVPAWQRDETGGRRPINARSETVATAPMFREAWRARRALMPVDGFFEWRAIGGAKQPYAVAMASGEPFALAAIWEEWHDPRLGARIRTFAVLTCPANALMAEIHHRMPVILAPADYDRWLSDAPDPRDLLRPYPSEAMRIWPVSRRVNAPRNDGADLLDPVPDPREAPAGEEAPAQGRLF
ncbi:SOS response-associated peptidase [Amaricoccus solimangrovi]|uniref:Abasic site processing protein n=1 Tax=Amaricoccus solimangrovi TaxID=2589815 RepID=A0A501W9F2_9RHOB|nr:SOS response-associated peptidase [Amaricoccus solimangrovi]TPE46573.1 SOS response-associated peptidase [Amaricoccus solimangrovi]